MTTLLDDIVQALKNLGGSATLKEIYAEVENVEKCKQDSDCIAGDLTLPCSFINCVSIYNKDADLTKLKSLSTDYENKCDTGTCSIESCPSIGDSLLKCINYKCTSRAKVTEATTPCNSDSDCSAGKKCAQICNQIKACHTPEELTTQCQPNW